MAAAVVRGGPLLAARERVIQDLSRDLGFNTVAEYNQALRHPERIVVALDAALARS